MLERQRLELAVDLHERSYLLLRWMAEAIPKGFISFDKAHHYASLPAAAQAWLTRHHDDLPVAARPPLEHLAEFSRLFASYLQVSFDLIREPGMLRTSPGAHCFCEMCSWVVAAPQLRAKKITPAMKARADKLSRGRVRTYARTLELEAARADALVADAELAASIALVTYAHDLIARMDGFPDGPSALALWRRFAWLPSGSPRPGFALAVDDIVAAETVIVGRLRAA